ncbi:hypothetical protein ACQY0O_005306 [Thecaphora frezii]
MLLSIRSPPEPLRAIRVSKQRERRKMASAGNPTRTPPNWRYAVARGTEPDLQRTTTIEGSPSQRTEGVHRPSRLGRPGERYADAPTDASIHPEASSSQPQSLQRPPQVRQKSWHHPYHTASRNAPGHPGGELDASHPYHHQSAIGGERRPSQSSEGASPRYLSKASSSSAAALRAYEQAIDMHAAAAGRADAAALLAAEQESRQLHPSSFPQQSILEHQAQTPFSGPKRNRGRASTLSLPQPELARQRAVPGYHPSPTYPTYPGAPPAGYGPGPEGLHSTSSSVWDEHRARRNSTMSSVTDASPAAGATPPLAGYQQQHSPLLFAPLSPHLGGAAAPAAGPSSRLGSGYFVPGGSHPIGPGARTSRPATPVSPLNMDELSMEDRTAPSGLAMSTSYHRMPHPYQRPAQEHPSGLAHHDRARSPSSSNVAPRPPRQEAMAWRREGEDTSSPTALLSSGDSYFAAEPSMHRRAAVGVQHPPQQHPQQHHHPHHPGIRYPQQTHPHPMPPPSHQMHMAPPFSLERADYERRLQMQAQMHAPGRVDPYASGDPQQRSLVAAGPMMVQPPMDRIAHSRRRRRPPYSYSSLIAQAISSSPEGRMTLREIYTWISNNYPGMYPMTGPESQGWQNTVRHNLSLNKSFIKVARTAQDIYDSCSSGVPSQSQAARGKGGWWMLDHSVAASQLGVGFRAPAEEASDEHDRFAQQARSAEQSQVASGSNSSTATPAPPRRLLRQRSYSDSVNRSSSASQRGASSVGTSSTAPGSRDEYSGYPSDASAAFGGATPRVQHELASTRRSSSGHLTPSSSGVEDDRHLGAASAVGDVPMLESGIPSVLQPRPMTTVLHDDEPSRSPWHGQPQRPRGFTTSAAEPSPLRLYSVSAQRQISPAMPPGSSREPSMQQPVFAARPFDRTSEETPEMSHDEDRFRSRAAFANEGFSARGSVSQAMVDAPGTSAAPSVPLQHARSRSGHEEEDIDMEARDDVSTRKALPPTSSTGIVKGGTSSPGGGTQDEAKVDTAQASEAEAVSPHGSRRMAISGLLNG